MSRTVSPSWRLRSRSSWRIDRVVSGVQGAGGLVGEQHLGVAGEGAGDADALLLTAGELGRVGLGLVGQADEVEQLQRLAGTFLPALAEDFQRQFDVVLDGARGQQVEVLEHHADAAARPAELPAGAGAAAGERGEVLAGHGHGARGGTLQQVDAADEGGLAGAGLADDAVDLAFADVQVDAVQGGDLAAARAVDLGEARGGDHVDFRHCRVRGASWAPGTGHAGKGGRTARLADMERSGKRRARGAARPRVRGTEADVSRLSLRGARLRRCGGPLEGAHSEETHTTSTGRHRRLGRRDAVARRGHAASKADVHIWTDPAVRMVDSCGHPCAHVRGVRRSRFRNP
ncbi:hypothetical protein GA0115245_12477 [Streptomyces sp. di188]|nr:hypothetical protein GA0115245_12477 [Streptomyces sp. di188]